MSYKFLYLLINYPGRSVMIYAANILLKSNRVFTI